MSEAAATPLLHHLELGDQNSSALPLVVLHGLYGSSRNWRSVGKKLGAERRVLALDLPNHGESYHHPDCSYGSQAQAVARTLQHLAVNEFDLMGHSMGGKVGMALAAQEPEAVRQLLILDIGPWARRADREYASRMLEMPMAEISSRGDAEHWLGRYVDDRATLLFLLTNLVRSRSATESAETVFEWQLGLGEIVADFAAIEAAPLPAGQVLERPTAFLGGQTSGYLSPDDLPRIRSFFPAASLDFLEGVGHNVHIEGGQRFVDWVESQLGEG